MIGNKSRVVLASLFVSLSCAVSALAAEGDWPAWRGANRDGKSTDKNLLKSWPADGPKLLWKVGGIGAGYSSVSIADDKVYVTGQKGGQLYLSALSDKGKKLWSKNIGPAFTKSYPGARSTATYDDGRLYVVSGLGQISCHDANKKGKRIWRRQMSDFGGNAPGWGFSESVLVVGNYAIVTPGGRACIVALHKKTGKTAWESKSFGSAHYSSPIYVEFNKINMIVNGTQAGLIAVDAKTGKTLWTNNFAAGNTANCPTPAYSDGYVFWANGYGKGGICLKLEADGAKVSASEVWRTSDMVSHHGGYVIVDGYVYGNHGNGWSCLDLKSGDLKWRERGVGKGSLCYADGMLYLFGERGGEAMLAEASPDGFKSAGQFSVSGNGPSWAHPVVTGGKLYLRYSETVYCYDVKASE